MAAKCPSRRLVEDHWSAWISLRHLTGTYGTALAIAVLAGFFFADAFDTDDLFALSRIEDDDALRAATGDADAFDRTADQLAAIGHQHDSIAIFDRHGGDERAVTRSDRHGDNAFAAAPGDAIFVRGGALAIAIGGDGQNNLLLGRHFGIALGR